MSCPRTIAPLPCGLTGVGFTAAPWDSLTNTLTLQHGQGANFPALPNGETFWVDIDGCNCCMRVQVTGRSGDVFTVVPPVGGACACTKSNSRVAYATNSAEHIKGIAAELGINVVPPLKFDCVTRTLSIDCEQLKTMVFSPCGM
jgi:hypothetical protein